MASGQRSSDDSVHLPALPLALLLWRVHSRRQCLPLRAKHVPLPLSWENPQPERVAESDMHDLPHAATTTAFADRSADGGSPLPPPRKAQRHRKRHTPVGPAGVWFQNVQQSADPSSRKGKDNDDEEEDDDHHDALQNLRRSVQRRAAHSETLASFSSPAWIAMQCDRRWVTPSLPANLTLEERYRQIRPHVPAPYSMIHELLQAIHSPRTNQPSSDPWHCSHLMVLVTNIHGGATDHGWTAALTDETGATLTAWIQPASVHRQLQQPSTETGAVSWFRTGIVWWLKDTTLLLSPSAQSSEREVDDTNLIYLLLVSEDNIQQVWTPSDGEALSDERYLQWMEQRTRLRNGVESGEERLKRHAERGEPSFSETVVLSQQRQIAPLDNASRPSAPLPFRAHPLDQPSQLPCSMERPSTTQRTQWNPLPKPPRSMERPSIAQRTQWNPSVKPPASAERTTSPQRTLWIPPPKPSGSKERPPARQQTPSPAIPLQVAQTTPSRAAQNSCNPAMTAQTNSTTHSQATASSKPPDHLPTMDSSPRPTTKHQLSPRISPFAAFAYTPASQQEGEGVGVSNAAPAGKAVRGTPQIGADRTGAQNDTTTEKAMFTSPEPSLNQTEKQRKASSVSSSTRENKPSSAIRPSGTDHASLATTQSSGKSGRSSSRKRRRRAAPSKLWTSGVDLDLSDSDDDSVDRKAASPPSTDPDERAEAPPRSIRSLFRPEALQLFDDLLSSDDDDDDAD